MREVCVKEYSSFILPFLHAAVYAKTIDCRLTDSKVHVSPTWIVAYWQLNSRAAKFLLAVGNYLLSCGIPYHPRDPARGKRAAGTPRVHANIAAQPLCRDDVHGK